MLSGGPRRNAELGRPSRPHLPLAGGTVVGAGGQSPACLHICVTMRHVEHVGAIVASMTARTAAIMRDPAAAGQGQGAAIYGAKASMPTEGVEGMLASYLDGIYEMPEPGEGRSHL